MTKLYELREQEIGFIDGALQWYRRQDTAVRYLLASTVPVLGVGAVLASAEIVAAGAACGTLALIAGLGNTDLPLPIEKVSSEQAEKFIDPDGSRMTIGIVYAQHPKLTDLVIPTPAFQDILLREQQADIIDYVRSIVPARWIEIRQHVVKSGGGGGSIFSLNLSGEHSNKWETLTDLNYDRPEVAPLSRSLIWLDRFPSLVAGIRSSIKGSAQFVERVQQNAHLATSIAKQAGFAVEAVESYELEISIKW